MAAFVMRDVRRWSHRVLAGGEITLVLVGRLLTVGEGNSVAGSLPVTET